MNAKRKSSFKQLGLAALILVVLSTSGCIHIHNREAFYFGSYSEAERLFAKGEFDKAIQKYQAYIDENPEGNLAIISQYYIARSHAALGHKDEALQLFRQIIEKYPDVIWANFSQTQLKELESATVKDESADANIASDSAKNEAPAPSPETQPAVNTPPTA